MLLLFFIATRILSASSSTEDKVEEVSQRTFESKMPRLEAQWIESEFRRTMNMEHLPFEVEIVSIEKINYDNCEDGFKLKKAHESLFAEYKAKFGEDKEREILFHSTQRSEPKKQAFDKGLKLSSGKGLTFTRGVYVGTANKAHQYQNKETDMFKKDGLMQMFACSTFSSKEAFKVVGQRDKFRNDEDFWTSHLSTNFTHVDEWCFKNSSQVLPEYIITYKLVGGIEKTPEECTNDQPSIFDEEA